MNLNEIRSEIDKIDDELVRLFCQRMHAAAQVADYKKANNLPIFQPARERAKLQDVAEKAGPEMANYTRVLYSMLFELSRSYQSKRNGECSPLYRNITQAIEHTPKLFPQAPMVACQGVEGAYSQIACEKIFKNPFIMYFKSFEAVFSAIDQGLCQYGILPIENSTAGSVNKVYDLMIEHNFSIVRTFRLKIDHNLLVNPGTNLADIKEVYSHEQAINPWTTLPSPPRWSPSPAERTLPPCPAAPAPSCTDWIVCAAPCRTRATTAPASSASAGIWKFTPAPTRPPS